MFTEFSVGFCKDAESPVRRGAGLVSLVLTFQKAAFCFENRTYSSDES
jgi:hypothetical protein